MASAGNCAPIDPESEQEIVNSTQNIHALFRTLDDRFFWGKLCEVCVSWSEHITSPGIFSHNAVDGLCRINLNKPLLVERPRKDLVNTLLHEMIHAYLYLTENDTDRDRHGLEFRRHMGRINTDAGTSITTQHSFHESHCWKCIGPCQYRKPSFGIVQRTVDRPPGPCDEWWADHLATCGGIFIKVNSPKRRNSPQEDIWVVNKFSSRVPGVGRWKYKYHIKSYQESFAQNLARSQPEDAFISVRKHWQNKYPRQDRNQTNINCCLESTSDPLTAQTQDAILRSEALQKSADTKPNCHTDTCDTEISKVEECIICLSKIDHAVYDIHISKCMDENFKDDFSNENIGDPTQEGLDNSKLEIEKLVAWLQMMEENQRRIDTDSGPADENQSDFSDNYLEHVQRRSQNSVHCGEVTYEANLQISDGNSPEKPPADTVTHAPIDAIRKFCPVCNKSVSSLVFDMHLEACLVAVCVDMEKNDVDANVDLTTTCPACGEQLVGSQLESHLEQCLVAVFRDSFDLDDVADHHDHRRLYYDCPFCFGLYSETEMSCHLSKCIQSLESRSDSEMDKKLMLNELFDEAQFALQSGNL